jgi:hypothetical protein
VIAALYVQTGGVYYGLPDVDPWDEARDARLYDGPWPVVAHPPCARWSRLAGFTEARFGYKRGEDGGCFEAALRCIREFGGVLEHPGSVAADPVREVRVLPCSARGGRVSDLLRVYFDPAEIGPDGYPLAWHNCQECVSGRVPYGPPDEDGEPAEWDQCGACLGLGSIKDLIRWEAGNRCVRCGHPYEKGAGEWSPCDENCRHDVENANVRARTQDGDWILLGSRSWEDAREAWYTREAQWRILTVHHLNRVKRDCRWWNLAALCQRCHLTIQGKVYLERPWKRNHSDWFKPYAAGWYAWSFLGQELTREQTMARLDELLALEDQQLELA